MKKRYTDQQIAYALREVETGTAVTDTCRKMGISEQTFYNWKKKYSGMGVPEIRRLKALRKRTGNSRSL